MTVLKIKWFWLLLPFFSLGFAQGDANLLLQYNRGPDLDAFYRKWNFDLHTHFIYGNMRENYTVSKITYSVGAYIQFKFSKTFALNSGADYFNLSYQYNLRKNQTYDQLTYLSIPLTIRVFPSRKIHFETGLLYKRLLSAQNTKIVDLKNRSNKYPNGVFKNAFGWLFTTQYNVWKRFDVSLQYRFFKKEVDPLIDQKNNFDAFLLGIHFYVLNPKKKPK
tara:strand:+ start:2485 stop:3144 length:660 start_codon:yes stop_codon:yes gene_type:complete